MSADEQMPRTASGVSPVTSAAGLSPVPTPFCGQVERRRVDILDHAPHVAPPVLPPPQGGISDVREAVNEFVGRFGPALGNVFLIPHPWIGMILWFALGANLHLVAFGLLGLAIALAGMAALGLEEEVWAGGGLKANTLMAAVVAGWVTAPTIYPLQTQIAIAATAAAAAFIITAAIMRALRRTEWPSLLWGYCIVAVAIFALFPIGAKMAVEPLTWWHKQPENVVEWGAAFLKSIGALLFAPTIAGGAAVACAALLWSRAAFAAGVIAWIAGAVIALNVQSLGVPYVWLPASYNFFVAGMAIGAFLIVPGYFSLLLAGLAGAVASLIDVALQSLFPLIAYLPAAAGLTIWAGLGTLALASDRRGFWRNRWPKVVPEEAWWRDTLWLQRFGRGEPLLVIPVAGSVQVTPGDGDAPDPSNHFPHELDAVRLPIHNGAPAEGDCVPADSIWNAAVTAPAAGIVAQVRDGIPDNPLGVANFSEAWGNYVSIHLDQGGWALLAYLKQGSIAVKPGARVELGTYLGAVGNSGRSAVPHLHLQAQAGPEPGARTMPFRLANYLSGATPDEPLLEWNAAKAPEPGSIVMHAVPNAHVRSLLASSSPGTAVWTVEVQGTLPRSFREPSQGVSVEVRHSLDELGRHRFMCGDSTLAAALAPDAWRVVEQSGDAPLLRLWAHGAPSVPYAVEVGLAWTDIVPAIPAGLMRWVTLTLGPYRLRPFTYTRSVCRMAYGRRATDRLVVETALAPRPPSLPSKITCSFDKARGLVQIEAAFDSGSVRYSMLSFTPGAGF
ncbi:MAG: urea transporter [Proteobacteria bacterium]|nr:urea transporter [Pseudomonadota bacterium]